MTYTLKYNVSALVKLTPEQFAFLFTAYKNSENYFAEAEPGGFMYGNLNKRKSGIEEAEFNAVQLNQALKVLEAPMKGTERETIKETLQNDLFFILKMVKAETERLREITFDKIA